MRFQATTLSGLATTTHAILRRTHRVAWLMLGVATLIAWATPSDAMPIFARKYDLKCSFCHITIPRLNEFGFKFRAAGFRLPTEIGKEDTTAFDMAHYIAVDVVGQAVASSTSATGTPSTSSTQLSLGEIGLHPLTGSLTKDLSSDIQMSFAPGPELEIENAYGRYNAGSQDGNFSVRIGVMHPFEGYGGMDEPMGLSRPLFQENSAVGPNGPTLFTPWGFNQFGAEVGYTMDRTAFRASVLGGNYFSPADGSLHASQGGSFMKPTGYPSSSNVDLQLTATQILSEYGGGISGYFYLGNADLPTGITTTSVDSQFFQNKFMRYALYASYPPIEQTMLMAGYEQGTDNSWIDSTWRKGSDFTNKGWFVEADYTPFKLTGIGVRYDQFKPSTSISDNDMSSIAAFVNYAWGNGLQVIAEYQTVLTKTAPGQSQTDNAFTINIWWIH